MKNNDDECAIFTHYTIPRKIDFCFENLLKKADSLLFFYLSKVLRRRPENVFVDVKFRKNGYGLSGKQGMIQQTFGDQEYEILLNASLPSEALLIALQHELIHLKQYFLHELTNAVEAHRDNWKGQVIDTRHTTYMELPWEKQAFSLERRYYNQWKTWYEQNGEKNDDGQ